jgi:hypothetical protein
MPIEIHDRTRFSIVIDDWERLRGTPVEAWLKKNFQKVWDLYKSNWSWISNVEPHHGDDFVEPDTSLAIIRTIMGTNNRGSSGYTRRDLNSEAELGTIVPLRTISDDGMTISSFPIEILAHLSEDLPTLDFGTKTFTCQRVPQIKARQSLRARIDRYSEWRGQPIYSDILGAFSFLGELNSSEDSQEAYLPIGLTSESLLTQLQEQLGNDTNGRQKKVATYRISSLYRGGGLEPTVEKWQSKPSSIQRGSTIFAYKREVEVLNQFTRIWETKMMICLGTFEPMHKAIQYKKARTFWPGLLKSFAGGAAERWFDTDAWKEKRIEHWAQICKFWDAPMETFGESTMDAPPEITMALEGDPLEDKHFVYIESADGIKHNPDEIKYQKISKKVVEITKKQERAQSNLRQKKADADSYEYNITDKERRITELQADINRNKGYLTSLQNQYPAIQAEIDALSPTVTSIQAALAAQKTVRDLAISTMLANSKSENGNGWLTNIESTMGIQIREVYYDDSAGMRSKKLSEYPDAPAKVLSEGWKLKMIKFTTNKPMIIKVDAHENPLTCKKVAGGPWHVTLTRSSRSRPCLQIRLLSASSIYGKNNDSYKVHPHSNPFTLHEKTDFERWGNSLIQQEVTACLGEAEPILYKAFEDNSVKMAIMGAMTWLTNANGSDPWGKHWRWFPRAEDVNLQGLNLLSQEVESTQEVTIDSLITTGEGMDVLAARLLGNVDEYETVAEGYEEPLNEVPSQAIVTEDLNNRNNLLSAIEALENRTVERGGYVPYAQR